MANETGRELGDRTVSQTMDELHCSIQVFELIDKIGNKNGEGVVETPLLQRFPRK